MRSPRIRGQHCVKFCSMNYRITPRVSVVIPVYNGAKHLERALDSALAQTMLDLEIIVVDDGSSDATFEVACRVATRDSRIRLLCNERNLGAAASRNRALGEARGEWIALLDGDDAWLPNRLERMLAHSGHADVVSDDVYVMRGWATKVHEPVFWSFLQLRGLNLTKPCYLSLLDFVRYDLGALQPMIRYSFLKRYQLKYNPALRITEDYHLYFEMLASGARWLQLPSAYYFYYHHTGNVTGNALVFARDTTESTEMLLRRPAIAQDAALVAALERRVQEAHSIMVFAIVRATLRQRHFGKFARLLFFQPTYLKPLVVFVVKALVRRIRMKRRRISELEEKA